MGPIEAYPGEEAVMHLSTVDTNQNTSVPLGSRTHIDDKPVYICQQHQPM
jgi:hypothetical protein